MITALLVLHAVAAAFWFGSTVLLVTVVQPSLVAAGANAQFVAPHLFRRVPPVLGTAGATTILSGIALYAMVSGGFASGFARSTGGMMIGAGALCGFAAIVTGIITGRLQERGAAYARASFVLLTCAFILMIAGSHV